MVEFAVIGAGPAGLSCALFLAKAGRRTTVVDTGQSIIRRADVHNYLGFPEGMAGNELIARGKAQVERYGGTFMIGKPVRIEPLEKGFNIFVGENTMRAAQIVLATGIASAIVDALGLPLVRGPYGTRVVETDREGRSTLKGVWVAGSLAGSPLQAIVAAGDGARVAVNIMAEIRGSIYMDHDVLPSHRKRLPTVPERSSL